MTNTGYILVEIVTESTSGDDEYYDQEYEVKNTIAHSNNKEELEEEAESLNRNYQKINDKIVGLNKYIQDYNSKFEIELVNKLPNLKISGTSFNNDSSTLGISPLEWV